MTSATGSTTAHDLADGSTSLVSTSESSEGTTDTLPDPPLLQTTLDDVSAITEPTHGDGTDASVSSTTTSSFVPTPWNAGVEIQQMGQWVRFRQVAEQPNIELDRGTIELQFRPAYDHDDGTLHRLLATDGSLSGLRIRKNANGRFAMILVDQDGIEHITAVDPDDYAWPANEWIHVRVTWDTTDPTATQAVHIYFNEREAPRYVVTADADITMGPENPSGWLYLGSRSDVAANVANGILDELTIFDEPRLPQRPSSTKD